MKAFLKFDLDDPQDREAHLRCVKSLDMALVLGDIAEHLRAKIKYSEEDTPTFDAEELRTWFHSLLRERGVDLDELVS